MVLYIDFDGRIACREYPIDIELKIKKDPFSLDYSISAPGKQDASPARPSVLERRVSHSSDIPLSEMDGVCDNHFGRFKIEIRKGMPYINDMPIEEFY